MQGFSQDGVESSEAAIALTACYWSGNFCFISSGFAIQDRMMQSRGG